MAPPRVPEVGAGHRHPLHVHGHSVVHHLAPEVKVAATVAFAVALATVPNRAWPAFLVLAGLAAVAVATARLPVGFVATRALVVVPFVVFGLLVPFVSTPHDASFAAVRWSTAGAWAGGAIIWRSVLGVTVSIVLAGTTELPRLLEGLERLRVPSGLVAIAAFMLRYLEIVARELSRMRAAMVVRGHDPRWIWQLRPLATASGALFVRTYERGERVHLAMVSRGWSGTMPPPRERPPTHAATPAIAWAGTALVVAVAARVLGS